MTARYKLILEYDGSGFVGWQRQDNGTSIQEAVEAAIEQFSGERVRVLGAGRTDAGVHALGQVAHFDLAKNTDGKTIANALNAHLRPDPISVLFAEAVDEKADSHHDGVGSKLAIQVNGSTNRVRTACQPAPVANRSTSSGRNRWIMIPWRR